MKAEQVEQDVQIEQMHLGQIKEGQHDKDEGETNTCVKGFDFKNVPKTEQYHFGEEKEFYVGRDLFNAFLSAHDERWVMILDEEDKGKKVLLEGELQMIRRKLTMKSDIMNKCTHTEYTPLLQYTKGEGFIDGVVPPHCTQGSQHDSDLSYASQDESHEPRGDEECGAADDIRFLLEPRH